MADQHYPSEFHVSQQEAGTVPLGDHGNYMTQDPRATQYSTADQHYAPEFGTGDQQDGMIPWAAQGNYLPQEPRQDQYSMAEQHYAPEFGIGHQQAGPIPTGAHGNYLPQHPREGVYSMADLHHTPECGETYQQIEMIPLAAQGYYLPQESRQNEYSMAEQQYAPAFSARYAQTGMIPLGAQGNYLPQQPREIEYSMVNQHQVPEFGARHQQTGGMPMGAHGNYLSQQTRENEYGMADYHLAGQFAAGNQQTGMIPLGSQGNYIQMQSSENQQSYSFPGEYAEGVIAPSDGQFRTGPHGNMQRESKGTEYTQTYYQSGLVDYSASTRSFEMEAACIQGKDTHGEFNVLEEFRNQTAEFTAGHVDDVAMQFGNIGNHTQREPGGSGQIPGIEDVQLDDEYDFILDYIKGEDKYNEIGTEAQAIIQQHLQPKVDATMAVLSNRESELESRTERADKVSELETNETLLNRINEEDIEKFRQQQIKAALPKPIIKEMVDYYRSLNDEFKLLQVARIGLHKQMNLLSELYREKKIKLEQRFEFTEELRLDPTQHELVNRRDKLILELENEGEHKAKEIQKMAKKVSTNYYDKRRKITYEHEMRLRKLFDKEFPKRPKTIIELDKSYLKDTNELLDQYQTTTASSGYQGAQNAIRSKYLIELLKRWKQHFKINEPVPITKRTYKIGGKAPFSLDSKTGGGRRNLTGTNASSKTKTDSEQIGYVDEDKDERKTIIDTFCKQLRRQGLPEPIIKYLKDFYKDLYEKKQIVREKLADVVHQENKMQKDHDEMSIKLQERRNRIPTEKNVDQSEAQLLLDIESKEAAKLKEAEKSFKLMKKQINSLVYNFNRKHATTLPNEFDEHLKTSKPKEIVIEEEEYQENVEKQKRNYMEIKKAKDKAHTKKAHKAHAASIASLRHAHMEKVTQMWKQHYKIEDPFKKYLKQKQNELIRKQKKGPAKSSGQSSIREGNVIPNQLKRTPSAEGTAINRAENEKYKGQKKGNSSKKDKQTTGENKSKPTDRDIENLTLKLAKHSKKQHGQQIECSKTLRNGKSTSKQDRVKADQMKKAGMKRKADQIRQEQVSQTQDNVWKRKFEDPEKTKKTQSKQWREKAEKEQQRKATDSKSEQQTSQPNRERGERTHEARESDTRKRESQRQVQTPKNDRDANWKKVVNEYEGKHC